MEEKKKKGKKKLFSLAEKKRKMDFLRDYCELKKWMKENYEMKSISTTWKIV